MSSAMSAAERTAYIYELVHVHAILFCLAWGLFAPIALLLVRGVNVRAHYILQTLVVLMSMSGFGVAVYFSRLIPRPIIQSYSTYHQGIGIFVFTASIVQALGGAAQHMLFKRSAKAHHAKISGTGNEIATSPSISSGSEPEKTAARIDNVDTSSDGATVAAPFKKPGWLVAFGEGHMWFGRIIMILGVINVGFGFQLVGWNNYAIGVGVGEAVILVTCLTVSMVWGMRNKRKAS